MIVGRSSVEMTKKFESKLYKLLSDEQYYECIKDMINSDPVKLMDTFIQHGSITTLEHCVSVSYKSYKIAKRFHMDYKAAARAGLIHDMFLYDWHLQPKGDSFLQKHGFTHPQRALENAMKHFTLSEREKDIISKHMWPLTLRKVPKYKESFVVSFVDKYIACKETVSPYLQKISDYLL